MGRIVMIIGTCPEIIETAPVVKALDSLNDEHVFVHSGQHHDPVARILSRDLVLREPDPSFELRDRPPHLQVATRRQLGWDAKDTDLVVAGATNTNGVGTQRTGEKSRDSSTRFPG